MHFSVCLVSFLRIGTLTMDIRESFVNQNGVTSIIPQSILSYVSDKGLTLIWNSACLGIKLNKLWAHTMLGCQMAFCIALFCYKCMRTYLMGYIYHTNSIVQKILLID